MFVELHILQNFAPSNLNRDDTNAPKECEFGGFRRARISSQCLKRAIRGAFDQDDLLPEENRAVRTKLLSGELGRRFVAAGKDEASALAVAAAAIGGLGLKPDEKNPERTQYLLFLGKQELDALVEVCLDNWEHLAAVAPTVDGEKKLTTKQMKSAAKEAVGAVGPQLQRVLDGGRAADVALFGRMIADLPQRNVDAAAQVAHAISTHKVGTAFDFYTAVDDIKPDETEGAGMMGFVEFNSACFYRYLNVDMGQLQVGLAGDAALTQAALRAFILAAVHAIPTGKQNSMAAHNPPSLIFAIVRDSQLQNLANAFVRPISNGGGTIAGGDTDIVHGSIRALDAYWNRLGAMYGHDSVGQQWLSTTYEDGHSNLAPTGPVPLAQLVDGVVSACGMTG